MKKPNKLNNGRKNIAVLVGSMSSFYQDEILRGATSAAKEKDFNIIGFCGGPFNSPNPLALPRESLFDLVDTGLFDGVIIPVSSHTRYLDKEQTQAFVDKFKGIPLINIGGIIPGSTNIMSDYAPGLINTIEHFVNDHGYKKIAFFRGPANHASSNEREHIYRETLQKLNIVVHEELIINGDLRKESGANSVSELFDMRKQTCDAIICINDSLALGVLDELNKRHLKVPEDIAISGSLGNAAGLFCDPPLTTILEPSFELGFTAINEMSKCLEGNYTVTNILVPTQLLKRKSCGCHSAFSQNLDEFEVIKSTHFETIQEKKDLLYQTTVKEIHKDINLHRRLECYQDIEVFLPVFHDSIMTQDFTEFFEILIIKLNEALKTSAILPWLKVAAIFEYTGIELFKLFDDKQVVENYLKSISLIIEEMTNKALIFQNSEADFRINFSREIVNNLNSSFDFEAVRSYAVELLDLTELYISIYDNNTINQSIVKNLITVRDKKLIEIPIAEKTYPSNTLIPQSVALHNERYDLVVLPLAYHKKSLGYLMVNLTNQKGSAYENMLTIISTSLKNELQIQKLNDAEARFSDIAHSTSDWLWETDASHNFTYSSLSIHETIGFSNDEIIGQSINKNTLEEWLSFYETMEKHQTIVNTETWFYHKNGNLVCLLISCTPIVKEGIFTGYRGVFKNITEKRLQEDKIKTLANYDILTGLPNRTFFQDKFKALHTMSMKNHSKYGLMHLDIDRFKHINDSMGHTVGDQILTIIGDRLKKALRLGDTLARLGADEFTILLPNINSEHEIVNIAKRVIEETMTPIKINDKEIFITLSIGITIYPADGVTSEALLKNADIAMYRAKSRGRNRYVFYDRRIDEKNTSRIHFEGILHKAIKENNFFIQYQPKVHACTKKLSGLEALVRIKDPNEGIISPGLFIDIAEDLGLIDKIDEIVISMVCQQINSWQKEGIDILPISVNLSPSQLKQQDVFIKYMKIVNSYDIHPNMLELEITENALISNEKLALEILTDFVSAGFSIALDDFGIGYSSLSSISLYPLSTIKIDKSFISHIEEEKSNKAIIKAIIQMASDLNMKVVAEGVETKSQFDLIKSLGCTQIQGFYFSKPIDPDEVITLMTHGFSSN